MKTPNWKRLAWRYVIGLLNFEGTVEDNLEDEHEELFGYAIKAWMVH